MTKIEMVSLDEKEIHDLLGRVIAPRPVALISTVGTDGIYNAAPFSAITPVCFRPPIICVSIGMRRGEKKDTLRNIEFSGDFVINIMDETLIKATIQTSASYPSVVDEISEVGLTAIASDRVKSPRIAEAQVSLECQFVQGLEFGEGHNFRNVIFGEVLLTHTKDGLFLDGRIEPSRLRAVGGLGGGNYCRTGDILKVSSSRV